jgi:hypothetical protein
MGADNSFQQIISKIINDARRDMPKSQNIAIDSKHKLTAYDHAYFIAIEKALRACPRMWK